MALYNDVRPKNFDDFYGNQVILNALKGFITKKKPPQVYLFTGQTGCGKTTLAYILAKKLKCYGSDFEEINSSEERGIDAIRQLIKRAKHTPMHQKSKRRVFMLDEAHKLTNDAQNALLKELENPPKHAIYILATTDPNKLLKAVLNRCQCFNVEPLEDGEMFSLLQSVAKDQKIELQKPIYDQITQSSQGHARHALQLLECVIAVDPDKQMEAAKQHAEHAAQTIELCRALLKRAAWSTVTSILKGLKGQDVESIRRQVLGYANAVLLNKNDAQAVIMLDAFYEPFFNQGFPGLTYACHIAITTT